MHLAEECMRRYKDGVEQLCPAEQVSRFESKIDTQIGYWHTKLLMS